jgi:hypothetical protein
MPAISMKMIATAVVIALIVPFAASANEPAGSVANSPEFRAGSSDIGAITAQPNGKKPAERLREGTRLIDVSGSFVSLGADSVTFAPTGGKDAYRVLENLALQRVSQQLDENRGPRQWTVSGLITEFRGSNYLLVTKAVVQLQDGDSAADR